MDTLRLSRIISFDKETAMNDIYLAHHGIKGQKWGVRRFENPDGTLTEAGKERYGRDDEDKEKKFWTDKKKKIAKRIAIGAAFVAAAGIGAKFYAEYTKEIASEHARYKANEYLARAHGLPAFRSAWINRYTKEHENEIINSKSFRKSREYIKGVKQEYGDKYWGEWKKIFKQM